MSNTVNYEPIDQIVVSLAHEMKNNESCYTGIGIPSAVVAIQLARMTHAPDLDFYYGGFWIRPDLDVDLFTIMTDTEAYKEAFTKAKGFNPLIQLYQYWEGPKVKLDFGLIRPAQIDRYGNINNSVIGDYNNPKVRLPGGAAVGDIINTVGRVLAYVPKHEKRIFVNKVDFVTGRGASPEWRRKVGLEGYMGISVIVTDLCVIDFHTDDGQMRVRSIHETSSIEEVRDKTGFDIIIPEDVPTTPRPTEAELNLLRTKVDPLEVRKFDSK
ncbi:MAG: CoA-transferase subunit beta [Candidatus Hodarchaeales archaeon]